MMVHLVLAKIQQARAFTRCTAQPRNGYATCALWRCPSWFALLSAAARVKSRRAVLSMTHRLPWPYALDYGVLSIPGAMFLADGRMDDGGLVEGTALAERWSLR
jgi:hypothetical protein